MHPSADEAAKPWTCECGKSYSRQDSLTRHRNHCERYATGTAADAPARKQTATYPFQNSAAAAASGTTAQEPQQPAAHSTERGPGARFLERNRLLPPVRRWALFPRSSTTSRFVDLTERALVRLLWHVPAFKLQAKRLLGATNDTSGEQMRPWQQPSLTQSSPTRLESPHKVDTWAHEHPGVLTLQLFGLSKRRYAQVAPMSPTSDARYLVTGTVRTNGHEIQLLALRKPSHHAPVPIPRSPQYVIGSDPGVRNPTAAVGMYPRKSSHSERRSTIITNGYLNEPTRRDAMRREATKTEQVAEAERNLRADVPLQEWLQQRNKVAAWHNGRLQAVGHMRARREKRSRLARAVHAVISCAPPADKPPAAGVLIAWGSGFPHSTDAASKDLLLRDMVQRESARRGWAFVDTDEYQTSKTCSACGSDSLKPHGLRHRECRDCGARLHRDTNAAVNIAVAAVYQAEHGVRPPHLAYPSPSD